jgi:pilus assembly protein CpaD
MFRKNALPRRRAAMVVHGVALAALALAMSGCTPVMKNDYQGLADASQPDYRLRHPIAVREAERTVELFIGTNFGGLNPSQRADVVAMAHAWRREATGGFLIDVPANTRNSRAAQGALHEVRSLLAAAEVPPDAVRVRAYRPTSARTFATLRLRYPKMTAMAGPCGMWPNDLGSSNDRMYNENVPYWNHGCANQRNLAAMVDNPADLVQPRGETPALSARRAIVLDKYRKGESTATQYPTGNQGKISEVGQ